jgi:thiamine kinase-like enzyme
MTNEELEKMEHRVYVSKQKMVAAQHKEKYLKNQIKQLSRKERTHRLCTRGGMLERFIEEPNLLTDEDVFELLMYLFHGERAQNKLAYLIERRKDAIETETS